MYTPCRSFSRKKKNNIQTHPQVTLIPSSSRKNGSSRTAAARTRLTLWRKMHAPRKRRLRHPRKSSAWVPLWLQLATPTKNCNSFMHASSCLLIKSHNLNYKNKKIRCFWHLFLTLHFVIPKVQNLHTNSVFTSNIPIKHEGTFLMRVPKLKKSIFLDKTFNLLGVAMV